MENGFIVHAIQPMCTYCVSSNETQNPFHIRRQMSRNSLLETFLHIWFFLRSIFEAFHVFAEL